MALNDFVLVSEEGAVVSAAHARVAPPTSGNLALDLYGSEDAVDEYAFEHGVGISEAEEGTPLSEFPNFLLIDTWSGYVFKVDLGWRMVLSEGLELDDSGRLVGDVPEGSPVFLEERPSESVIIGEESPELLDFR